VSRTNRPGLNGRLAWIPREAMDAIPYVSKTDLLEVAWDLAGLQNPTSCDDPSETIASLVKFLNVRRAQRGLKPFPEPELNESIRRMCP
jgi:hypothetical protein